MYRQPANLIVQLEVVESCALGANWGLSILYYFTAVIKFNAASERVIVVNSLYDRELALVVRFIGLWSWLETAAIYSTLSCA